MNANLMKLVLRRLLPVGVCAALSLCVLHADVTLPSTDAKVKVSKPAPKTVPFLGLALGQVDESLASQIDLPEGVGVLVRAVLPDSPAAKAGVKQHDVLHYFNDQLLVNEPQLQTLVHQAGIGADVTLKLLRKGKAESVVVKLGEHEEEQPQPSDVLRWRPRETGDRRDTLYYGPPGDGRMFNIPLNGDAFATHVRELSERMKQLEGKPEAQRLEELERFKKEIEAQAIKAEEAVAKQMQAAAKQVDAANRQLEAQKARSSASSATSKVWKDDKGTIRVEINSNDGKADAGGSGVVSATADDKGTVTVTQNISTRLAWNDGDGSGELVIENGKKKLSVKDSNGKQTFFGPVDTEEQLKALPPKVRERLESIQSNIQNKVKVDVRSGNKIGTEF